MYAQGADLQGDWIELWMNEHGGLVFRLIVKLTR